MILTVHVDAADAALDGSLTFTVFRLHSTLFYTHNTVHSCPIIAIFFSPDQNCVFAFFLEKAFNMYTDISYRKTALFLNMWYKLIHV